MNKIIIPNGGEAEIADYKEQSLSEYKNNPLIEALPPIYNTQEVIEKLSVYPEFNGEERKLDNNLRIHLVQRLFQCFQPLPFHLDLESKIARAIRQGYITRNPFRPELAQGFNAEYNMIRNLGFQSSRMIKQTACGFTFIGISGIGKTCSVERILSMYPQIICHSCYKGINFSMYQLVWLKLDAPFDSSVKGLCFEFFSEVDRLLGTNYYKKFSSARTSTNIMIPAMNQVARNTGLGCLIVDEIQHLSLAKSGGMERMLNFFVTLVNQIGIPVILIGTPKAIGVLQSEFRQARRGSGQGDMILDRIQNDKIWDLLINAFWKYQWTKRVTPLTKELSDVLYEESQGITDIVKKIYVMAQIKAITSGREEITPSIIRQTASENLKLVRPMIQALKTGDIRKIGKYDDICIMDVDYEGYFNKAKQIVGTNVNAKEKSNQKDTLIDKKEKAVLKLIELGVDAKKAQMAVDKVNNIKDCVDTNSIVIKAIVLSNNSYKLKTKTKKENNDPDDIRVIVDKAKKEQESAYEALKEKGYIKQFKDDIFNVG